MADESVDDNFSIIDQGETVADNMTMSSEAIVTFNGVTIFNPRDTYTVELHPSFLRLVGQTKDFTIHYSSIVDLFCLPESYQPQSRTFVVITLDHPIRLRQTFYPHIVMLFETDCVIKSPPYTSNELLKYKFKDRLDSPYKGLIPDFFAKILCALSSTEITRPGKFRSIQDDGYAVKCILDTKEGILYPLAECLLFLPEPPTLLHHTKICLPELQRVVQGSNKRYFNLIVRMMTGHEHLFRNIERSEYYNLKEHFSNNDLQVMTPSDEGSPFDKFGESEDEYSDSDREQEMHAERAKRSKKPPKDGDEVVSQLRKGNEKDPNAPKAIMTAFLLFSQAERESIRKENPSITFTDIGRIMGEKWRNMSAAEREPYEAIAEANRKRYLDEIIEYYHQPPTNMAASRNPSEGKARKSRDEEDEIFVTDNDKVDSSAHNAEGDGNSDDASDSSADENGVKLGKGMVAFLRFSRAERENTKKQNPSATFTDIWKILEGKWWNMSAAEKEPYEAMAQADKQRYKQRNQ